MHEEQVAPTPGRFHPRGIYQPVQPEYIRRVQQELAARRYDRPLVLQLVDKAKSKIIWTPLWEQATQS